MSFRTTLFAASAAIPLSLPILAVPVGLIALEGCSSGTTAPTMTLANAKMWLDDVINATMAAGQTYLAGNPPAASAATVRSIMADLTTAKTAFDALTDTSTAQSTALQVVTLIQSMLPIVTPYLQSGVAVEISLGLSVLQAFIAALPPPPAAPATPPATLHNAAMKFRA